MKRILDGESGSRGIVVDVPNKRVVVDHCWKKDKDSQRYQLRFQYVFDVKLEEVYRLAALWVNKDYQNRMRSEKPSEAELEKLEKQVISVTEMYSPRERGPVDPVKAASNAVDKMSDEERAAFVQKLKDAGLL